jgi:translation initiation factor 2 subunit 1
MAERKPQWPEVGDLVIANIESVTTYGACAKLGEYDKQGLLHVSEINSIWMRNIRDFVREDQKPTALLRGVVSNIVKTGSQGTFRREN